MEISLSQLLSYFTFYLSHYPLLPPPLPLAVFRLSCALPRRPHFGEVSVLDLLPGGTARFHCHMGYHLQGAVALTCLNASLPVWSSKEPSCRGREERERHMQMQGHTHTYSYTHISMPCRCLEQQHAQLQSWGDTNTHTHIIITSLPP
jgi:hypothetical protein